MADTVPPGKRLDRAALERIVLRAAQLQAGERDLDEGLTETEIMQLGRDVGIPVDYLRQAIIEEQTRAVVPAEHGLAAWLAGPRYVAAERTVPGSVAAVDQALQYWMTTGELLRVKRRFSDAAISWEPQRGTIASLKRSLGLGGRDYRLARTVEVLAQMTGVSGDRTHVRLVADVGNTRRQALGGAGVLASAGAGATGVGLVLGFALPAALVPASVALLVALLIARSRKVEQFRVALEQVLDRLEHDKIKVPPRGGERGAPLSWIAQEIRKQLGP
jgi:hypothetical protein